jgi:hypothetical protein
MRPGKPVTCGDGDAGGWSVVGLPLGSGGDPSVIEHPVATTSDIATKEERSRRFTGGLLRRRIGTRR